MDININGEIRSFETTDPDVNDIHIYILSGADSTDFLIEGNVLKTKFSLTKSLYNITITSTDKGGLTVQTNVVINTINKPVSIGLTPPAPIVNSSNTKVLVEISQRYQH